jgi:hypothetical protein
MRASARRVAAVSGRQQRGRGLLDITPPDGRPDLTPTAASADLARALERAAAGLARLDQALGPAHALRPAFLHRARLDAVRQQAAADGQGIDPWHLAAVLEGLRPRLERASSVLDRGASSRSRGTRWSCTAGSSSPTSTRRARSSAPSVPSPPPPAPRRFWPQQPACTAGSTGAASGHRCAPPWSGTGRATACCARPCR